jgi:hypothetical protein
MTCDWYGIPSDTWIGPQESSGHYAFFQAGRERRLLGNPASRHPDMGAQKPKARKRSRRQATSAQDSDMREPSVHQATTEDKKASALAERASWPTRKWRGRKFADYDEALKGTYVPTPPESAYHVMRDTLPFSAWRLRNSAQPAD